MTVIGTDTEPTDLSERAKQLGAWLNGLEELHPYESGEANDAYTRVVTGSIYTRLEAELLDEPSYRWVFRNPMQVKLGAGWEDEVVGERVMLDGMPRTVTAVTETDTGWVIHFDGGGRAVPRYTVLDLAYLPADQYPAEVPF